MPDENDKPAKQPKPPKPIIRLATINAPLFDHAGMKLSPRWSEVDLDEIGQEGRFALERYAGGPKRDARHRIIMVHPQDGELYDEVVADNASVRARAAARPAPAPSPTAKGGKA